VSEEELKQLARRGYEAWNEGDAEWFEANLAEDVEIETLAGVFLDLEPVYRGIDGWQRFWGVFRSAWSSIEVELEGLDVVSDCEVFAIAKFEGVGRESGVEASLTFHHWLTFQDGKLSRLRVDLPDQKELELDPLA
jgi:ketosteroid isomerase-like protein